MKVIGSETVKEDIGTYAFHYLCAEFGGRFLTSVPGTLNECYWKFGQTLPYRIVEIIYSHYRGSHLSLPRANRRLLKQCEDIRRLSDDGLPRKEIAKRLGVAGDMVRDVLDLFEEQEEKDNA